LPQNDGNLGTASVRPSVLIVEKIRLRPEPRARSFNGKLLEQPVSRLRSFSAKSALT
jgi:hypothetical protein